MDFEGNAEDSRFKDILNKKDFALDPTHKHYRKIAGGAFTKKQKKK
jgi:hypothetical protein